MKLLIFAGLYRFNQDNIEKNSLIIGVDRGALELINNQIIPDLSLGDFDSVTEEELTNIKNNSKEIKIFPKGKDFTDLELVFSENLFKHHNIDRTDIYGAIGERFDHTITAINILISLNYKNVFIHNKYSEISILESGKYLIYQDKYYYFSIYALLPSVIKLKNCKYPLNNYLLNMYDNLITSNQFQKGPVEATINGQVILVKSIKN